jgi:hypothetical protein
MVRFIPTLLLLLTGFTASAQPLDVEALSRQPGTTVTTRTENGRTATELSRAGVVITISPDGMMSMDTKGPAVWCLWEIAVGAKITTDVCHPGEFPQLSAVLGDFIDAANAFIVANSPRPVTLAQLEQAIAKRRAQAPATALWFCRSTPMSRRRGATSWTR